MERNPAFPDASIADITLGHPSVGDPPGWQTGGWVGFAKTEPSEGDDGTVRVTINMQPAFVTNREAAVLLRVTPSTIRQLVQQGKLDRKQFGDEHRITWESVVVLAEIQARISA